MSVVLPCDQCGAVDELLPVAVEFGFPDPTEEESWCPACVADALLEGADAEDFGEASASTPPESGA